MASLFRCVKFRCHQLQRSTSDQSAGLLRWIFCWWSRLNPASVHRYCLPKNAYLARRMDLLVDWCTLCVVLWKPVLVSPPIHSRPHFWCEHTGFKSESRNPMVELDFESLIVACRPSMSTIMTNLTPVLVNQPYMARRSSMAWSSPKSWSAVFCGIRASKISRHDDSRKENSRASRLSGGKSEMWSGLFLSAVSTSMLLRFPSSYSQKPTLANIPIYQ